MKLLWPFIRFFLPAILVIAMWSVLAWSVTHWRGVIFPTPWDTFQQGLSLLKGQPLNGHTIYRHVGDSLLRWLIGFGLASVAGIGIGLMAGWFIPVQQVVAPLLYGLQLIPGLAWIPVALLVFGIGPRATIFMITLTALAPIAINVMDGVKQVDIALIRAARMLGTSQRSLFIHVLIPAALPAMVTGLRIGLGNGWRVLVAAEMVVGTGTGLGFSIIEARWTLDYASAFACIGIICIMGLIVEKATFSPLERHTLKRWSTPKETHP